MRIVEIRIKVPDSEDANKISRSVCDTLTCAFSCRVISSRVLHPTYEDRVIMAEREADEIGLDELEAASEIYDRIAKKGAIDDTGK